MMEQFTSLLAVTLPDWTIPWAGIGAALAGMGSLLSGIAAYRMANRRDNGQKSETCTDDK